MDATGGATCIVARIGNSTRERIVALWATRVWENARGSNVGAYLVATAVRLWLWLLFVFQIGRLVFLSAHFFLFSFLTNRPISVVSGPEIMDKFVGSSEKNLRDLFDNPPDVYDTFRTGADGDAISKAALHVIGT